MSDEDPVDLLNRAATFVETAGSPVFWPLLGQVFRKVAWAGALDPDLLHRVGYPEVVALARSLPLEPVDHG